MERRKCYNCDEVDEIIMMHLSSYSLRCDKKSHLCWHVVSDEKLCLPASEHGKAWGKFRVQMTFILAHPGGRHVADDIAVVNVGRAQGQYRRQQVEGWRLLTAPSQW